jgi:hypothetical protein
MPPCWTQTRRSASSRRRCAVNIAISAPSCRRTMEYAARWRASRKHEFRLSAVSATPSVASDSALPVRRARIRPASAPRLYSGPRWNPPRPLHL